MLIFLLFKDKDDDKVLHSHLSDIVALEDPFADDNSQNQDDKCGVDIGRSEGCCIWRRGLNRKGIVTSGSSASTGADFVA